MCVYIYVCVFIYIQHIPGTNLLLPQPRLHKDPQTPDISTTFLTKIFSQPAPDQVAARPVHGRYMVLLSNVIMQAIGFCLRRWPHSGSPSDTILATQVVMLRQFLANADASISLCVFSAIHNYDE